MQPRKSTLWSLFLGRPTAFCSWTRTSKLRRMWASCLSSGTRTNWGTAWLEETSASKPGCMLGWFVIAWFREKGPTRGVCTVHPRRTSREPKTFADEGLRYSESWIPRMLCFTDVCVPPPVITSVVSEDSQVPPFFTSRWIPAVHKELYVIWKFISPQMGLLSSPPSVVLLKARSQTSLLFRDSPKREHIVSLALCFLLDFYISSIYCSGLDFLCVCICGTQFPLGNTHFSWDCVFQGVKYADFNTNPNPMVPGNCIIIDSIITFYID